MAGQRNHSRVAAERRRRRPLATLRFVLPAAALLVVIHPRDAWAYLDPGSGSMILQFALASVLSGLFALKLNWHRLKARLQKKPVEGDESRSDSAEDAGS